MNKYIKDEQHSIDDHWDLLLSVILMMVIVIVMMTMRSGSPYISHGHKLYIGHFIFIYSVLREVNFFYCKLTRQFEIIFILLLLRLLYDYYYYDYYDHASMFVQTGCLSIFWFLYFTSIINVLIWFLSVFINVSDFVWNLLFI